MTSYSIVTELVQQYIVTDSVENLRSTNSAFFKRDSNSFY